MLTLWLVSAMKGQNTPGKLYHATPSYLLGKAILGMKCGDRRDSNLPVRKLFLGAGEMAPCGLRDEHLS